MSPLYFGAPERRLYGVYHPAAPSAGLPRAAVLCQPWGSDYDQAHRAMRELANKFAANGVHVLRFDYYGTGDSSGYANEGDLDGWVGDVEAAIDEVREISGAEGVTLVGLRLGALLAGLAAANRPQDVAEVVLWDPILHRNYLHELEDLSANRLEIPPSPRRPGCQVVGHAIGKRLADDFQQLDIAATVRGLARPATLVVSGDEAELSAAAEVVGHSRLKATFAFALRRCWVDDPVLSGGFVPAPILNIIAAQAA